jgi:hypothetical protein
MKADQKEKKRRKAISRLGITINTNKVVKPYGFW